MDDCIFCKIVKGEIPATVIHEDDKTLAFLDIDPVNLGHSLVIPKEHYENIYETPENVAGEMMKVAKKLSKAVKNLPAHGVNITMNNDKAAGQVVFHAHVHVIPRHESDGFSMWKGKRGYAEGEKEIVAEKIKKHL